MPLIRNKWYRQKEIISKLLLDEEFNFLVEEYSFQYDGGWYIDCVKINNWIKTKIRIHHLIIGKPKEWMCVDHKNWNKLDNRKCNLHIVTNSFNLTNRPKRKDSSQIYKGIQLLPSWKYSARTSWWKRLWTFETAEEAYKCFTNYIYDKHKLQLTNV